MSRTVLEFTSTSALYNNLRLYKERMQDIEKRIHLLSEGILTTRRNLVSL